MSSQLSPERIQQEGRMKSAVGGGVCTCVCNDGRHQHHCIYPTWAFFSLFSILRAIGTTPRFVIRLSALPFSSSSSLAANDSNFCSRRENRPEVFLPPPSFLYYSFQEILLFRSKCLKCIYTLR